MAQLKLLIGIVFFVLLSICLSCPNIANDKYADKTVTTLLTQSTQQIDPK